MRVAVRKELEVDREYTPKTGEMEVKVHATIGNCEILLLGSGFYGVCIGV